MGDPPHAAIDTLVEVAVSRARALHKSPLGRDVARLSRLFTTERADRSPRYLRDPAARRAYLGFYAPLNAAKIAQLLAQLRAEGALPTWDAPRVLDLGAGPWTGLAASRAALGPLGASSAVDTAAAALADGRTWFEAAFGKADVDARVASLAGPPGGWRLAPVDLVVLANVLNELGDPRRGLDVRLAIVQAALTCLAPGGRVLIVEPGTRVHSRALMALRDAVRDDAVVLSPCRGAPACPLLARAGDWCHQDIAWRRPAAFERLERDAGIPKDTLKLSHLLLARPGDAPEPTHGLRLVGGTMRDKRGVERRYGCGAEGLVTLTGRPRLPPDQGHPARGALLRP